jgi:phytoene dehydrogenase-like protein
VVGAGPGGLTAAYYLAKKGHAVTVFDALPAAGGMARYGIPSYRVPLDVIDQEVAEVEKLGVEHSSSTPASRRSTTSSAQGYEAVLSRHRRAKWRQARPARRRSAQRHRQPDLPARRDSRPDRHGAATRRS